MVKLENVRERLEAYVVIKAPPSFVIKLKNICKKKA